ncbi:replication initiator [uncultured Agrococcus sp.]|uniref:replication initiator n=1 Tax=uncultured Agrococcus sp. TaxID=382258 RepID=UPI0025E338BD|nr:replication initiator [uncultured Agrococcus sp.]
MVVQDEAVKVAAADALLESVCVNPFDVDGDGSVFVRCNSRLASKCPSCSRLFQNDWAAIARSGVFDEDGEPLTGYSWALVTLTAPSFGKTHRVPHRLSDRRQRCACGGVHEFGSELAGEPVDPLGYDFAGTLLFNQTLGRLWNNTVTRWRRAFGKEFQYFAVTEAQKRGVMHKHVLVRYPRGSIIGQEFLAVASQAYTAAWTGEILRWGVQSDVQVLDAVADPDEAARTARYLVKMTAYAVKSVEAATGQVSNAAERLLWFAAHEYRCSAECDRPDGGRECQHPIHADLVGSERVLSQSKQWSVTGATRTGLREERRAFAAAMQEERGDEPATSKPDGMTAAELYMSGIIRQQWQTVAKQRQALLRQQWERLQEEANQRGEHEPWEQERLRL